MQQDDDGPISRTFIDDVELEPTGGVPIHPPSIDQYGTARRESYEFAMNLPLRNPRTPTNPHDVIVVRLLPRVEHPGVLELKASGRQPVRGELCHNTTVTRIVVAQGAFLSLQTETVNEPRWRDGGTSCPR